MKILPRLFIILLLFSNCGLAFALDYFDVSNPRFRPLQIILTVTPTGKTAQQLERALQANLERTLFFEVFKPQKESEIELSFAWELKLNAAQTEIQGLLRDLKEQRIRREFSVGVGNNGIAPAARALTNDLMQEVLGIPGLGASKIAYTARFPGEAKQIRLIDFDGLQDERFSFALGSSNLAHWAPDGKTLLYTHFTTTATQIALQPIDRPRARMLRFPDGTQPMGGSWSPDGQETLLTLMREGNADIYRYQLATGTLIPLVTWPSLETSPMWAPDGRTIAFVSDRQRFRQPGIYLFDIESQSVRRLPFQGDYASAPSWSPDGRQLLFEGQQERFFQIFKYLLDSDQIQQLTFGPFHSEQPDWAPNGQQIVFSANRTGVSKLYFMSAYGGRMIRVTNQPAGVVETSPAWSK